MALSDVVFLDSIHKTQRAFNPKWMEASLFILGIVSHKKILMNFTHAYTLNILCIYIYEKKKKKKAPFRYRCVMVLVLMEMILWPLGGVNSGVSGQGQRGSPATTPSLFLGSGVGQNTPPSRPYSPAVFFSADIPIPFFNI